MSGVTKHIYDHDICDILTMWQKQVKTVENFLPLYYKKEDLINMLKKYYPHEWASVVYKHKYYCTKDQYIKQHKGKARYNMPRPEALLERCQEYKTIMSENWRKKHVEEYSADKAVELKETLWAKREPKIRRIDEKIAKAKSYTQKMTPEFADQMIGLYERKNTSQKDRMYIILELKKYYSPKIIAFFFKLNDTELNKQLRDIAFKHLQSFDYKPRARRQKYICVYTKNKKRRDYLKKVYSDESCDIPRNPDELEYRIKNGKEQKIKTFDYFISHSSRDKKRVQMLIDYENSNSKNIFCDWINDADYLKRHLLCEATLKVLEMRMQQSKALIFVNSDNSRNSIWCKYELNYFFDLNKPMYIINIENISESRAEIKAITDTWFRDTGYKQLTLIAGKNITDENSGAEEAVFKALDVE